MDFSKLYNENKVLVLSLVILLVLVLLWHFGMLKVTKCEQKKESLVAFKSFEDAAASKYAAVTKDAGGMTADDRALEQAFMTGQTA